MYLSEPTIEFEKSYISLVNEFIENKETLVPFVLNEDHQDFPAMVNPLKGYAVGIGVPDNFVPHKTYWLTVQPRKLVGVVNLRFQLTERLKEIGGNIGFGIKPAERGKGYGKLILKYSLLKMKEAGLSQVLITYDKSNVASSKVIKENIGILKSEEYFQDLDDYVQRFIIEI